MAKVVTGEVRLSFPALFEPTTAPGSDTPKYSVMILVPKSDEKTVSALFAAEKAAAEAGKDSKFNGKVPKNLKSIIHDGDGENDEGELIAEAYPERAGHYFMTVSANVQYKPQVVDRNLNAVIDPSQVYSGVYGRVSLNSFPYSASGNKGVSFGLNNVQITRDGEPLSGRSTAEDDFEALEGSDLI